MSRIGKLPIPVRGGAKVTINGSEVAVEGPKGKLSHAFPSLVSFTEEDGQIIVTKTSEDRKAKAMHGTARALVNNMIEGVTNGYSRGLIIEGTGFRATVNGKVLDLSLGYSHPINFPIPDGITITVTDNTKVQVQGVCKQTVGEVCATIRSYYKPEPYKGKGVRYSDERIRRKEGKTAGK